MYESDWKVQKVRSAGAGLNLPEVKSGYLCIVMDAIKLTKAYKHNGNRISII